MADDKHWWLRSPGGLSSRISTSGAVIGRSPQCDIVLTDESASRSQALVYIAGEGPCIVVLGQGATRVNGADVDREQVLNDGDTIAVPGLDLTIYVESVAAQPAAAAWLVESGRGAMFGVSSSPFAIGSGPTVDVRIDDWPPQAVRLHSVGDRLHVEACVPVELDAHTLEVGEIELAAAGSTIVVGDDTLTIVSGGKLGDAATASNKHGSTQLPNSVHLSFLPRGGRLTVVSDGRERSLYLSDRKCDLVAALLSPPAPYEPGQLIPDDVLMPRIWPAQQAGRVNLNVLIHRVRHDLLRAQLPGADLLLRARGGRATRFALADGAKVVIE